jgi:hypothetical protein
MGVFLCFLKIHVLIFGSLIYLSYITYIKQKKHIVLDTILKITEEIPKHTPENYEIQLHSSTGFLIRLWLDQLNTTQIISLMIMI